MHTAPTGRRRFRLQWRISSRNIVATTTNTTVGAQQVAVIHLAVTDDDSGEESVVLVRGKSKLQQNQSGGWAKRVGIVDGQEIPRKIRRQQWSVLNVPLLWTAAENDKRCPMILWLVDVTQTVPNVVATECG